MHPLDRPHQQDTCNKIRRSRAKFIICQAPTGSGKSAWPGQMRHEGVKTMTLTRTKSLQAQYRDNYDFYALYGKGNYKCLNWQWQVNHKPSCDGIFCECSEYIGKGETITADLCCVSDDSQCECEERCYCPSPKLECLSSCEYPLARRAFINSIGGSLNYSKFLLDKWLVGSFEPEYLFLDEAHELSDLITDYVGLTVKWSDTPLEPFEAITIDNKLPDSIKEGLQLNNYYAASEWLDTLLGYLTNNEPLHPIKGGELRRWRKWESLIRRVGNTVDLMQWEPASWFVYTDEDGCIVKPLTARYHFKELFDKADKVVLMSATIGKIDNFVRELGIEDYEYIEVPNIWPPSMRRIEDISSGLRLTYKTYQDPSVRKQHAQSILDRINSCPDDWSGLVLSPSMRLTWDLADVIKSSQRPLFVPEKGQPTEKVAENWKAFYQQNDGAVCLCWQMWEGYDGIDNQFCIIAKTPVPNFNEPYDGARFNYDKPASWQKVANKLMQGWGRIRRGHPEHYGNNRVVAMADKMPTQVRNKISHDILKSIS